MGRKKREEGTGEKRELILKAAQKLFVTQGYSDVSMDALALAVPVSKRTLYNHFSDKKALFTAVMTRRCQFMADSIKEILVKDEQNVEQTLTVCGRHFLDVVLHPDAINIYRTAITQAPHFPDMGKLFYESGPKRSMKILAEYLGSYLTTLDSRGILHVPDSMRAAGVFFSMLVGRMQMRILLGVDKRIGRKEIEDHIGYVVQVFLCGNQPAARLSARKR
jgi:TetR/AcrR family transcriptional repressor of mexJK operon